MRAQEKPSITTPSTIQSSSDQQEIELKYRVIDDTVLEHLRQLEAFPPDYRLGPVERQVNIDTYCDTKDFTLLRSGYVLRIRHQSQEWVLTIKDLERTGESGLHSRMELEGSVTGETLPLQPAGWPDVIGDKVRAIVGDQPHLHTFARLQQTRQKRCVYSLGENCTPILVGEMSLDEVTIYDPYRSNDNGEPILVDRFNEVEIEAETGHSATILAPLAEFLEQQEGLLPSTMGKVEAAMQRISQHPPGRASGVQGAQPELEMAEAGRLVWRQQLVAMLMNEAGARAGADIEFVHDMRVAIRRARAAAKVFGPYFEQSAIRAHLKFLRKTAKRLGKIRDLDVAREKLHAYRAQRPTEEQKALAALDAHWHKKREKAYVALNAWLDSAQYRQALADFAHFCHTPNLGNKTFPARDKNAPQPQQVRHVLPSTILSRYEFMRAYEVLFPADGSSLPATVADETLHGLRLDGKRLRYALEFVSHLLAPEATPLLEQLKQLQDHLGAINDAVETQKRLKNLRGQKLSTAAVRHYRHVQEEIATDKRGTFPAVWRQFLSRSYRECLGRAITRL